MRAVPNVICHPEPTWWSIREHDHSMRIPRPDLSVKLGTPNACNGCHDDKDAAWALAQVSTWCGDTPTGFQAYAQALHDGRQETPGAGADLATLIRSTETPAIVRATAIARIGPYFSAATIDVLPLALSQVLDVHHALGLSLVRQKRANEGIEELRLASTLNPDNARYIYVYAVALNSTGKPEQAIMVLQGAHNRYPNNRDT